MKLIKSFVTVFVVLFSFSCICCLSKDTKPEMNKVKTTIRKVNNFDYSQKIIKPELIAQETQNTGVKKIHIYKKSLNKTKIDNHTIKESKVNENNFQEAKIIANPQPAKDIVTISFLSNVETIANLKIYSIVGRNLIEKNIDLKNGLNSFLIDISSLSSGSYFCVIEYGITFKSCRFMVY
jgi:hypothetical protein